jgi:hypothetical protein
MPGEKDPYVQEFGAGVSVSEDTDADETYYGAETGEPPAADETKTPGNTGKSSGGCDAGIMGLAAIFALCVLTAGRKRR